jgi:cytochrome P450
MADAGLLIATRSDGVAVTVAAALFYLLSNEECLAKLVREIHESFATLDDVCSSRLSQFSYLAAVVDEALRLTPSPPSAFPRLVLSGGLDVDGLHIPVWLR